DGATINAAPKRIAKDREVFMALILFRSNERRQALRSEELPAEHLGENQWCNNCCVGFNDIFRGLNAQLAPRDFLVGHSAGIRSEASRGIADLTKITPFGHGRLNVLIKHGHDANRKVTRNPTADLKEADGR